MVLYRCLHPTITPWFQQDVGRELSATIPTLRRGHKYEFKVRPYSGGTQGLDSNTRHLWIPEEGVLGMRDGWVGGVRWGYRVFQCGCPSSAECGTPARHCGPGGDRERHRGCELGATS